VITSTDILRLSTIVGSPSSQVYRRFRSKRVTSAEATSRGAALFPVAGRCCNGLCPAELWTKNWVRLARNEKSIPRPGACRRARTSERPVRDGTHRIEDHSGLVALHLDARARSGSLRRQTEKPDRVVFPYFASRPFSRLATPVAPRSRARRYQNTAVPESARKPRRWGSPEKTGSKVSPNLTAARATPASAARS
jgi:hypothetical protein